MNRPPINIGQRRTSRFPLMGIQMEVTIDSTKPAIRSFALALMESGARVLAGPLSFGEWGPGTSLIMSMEFPSKMDLEAFRDRMGRYFVTMHPLTGIKVGPSRKRDDVTS